MKKIVLSFIILTVLLVFSGEGVIKGQIVIDVETGSVFSGYNDVRIPGEGGTLFSLSEELSASPQFFYRLRGTYTIGTRHNLSVLFAPLTLKSEGMVPRDIIFEGVEFPSNINLEGKYKFNSYRLTYRYDIIERPKLEFGLGFTAKVRDASIALSAPGLESEKTNVGFVPILNFRLDWQVRDKLSLLIDGDALAAPQGRAEDVLLALKYQVSDRLALKAGYRVLEGGADNAEVYNFALINYAVVGIMLDL
jgi:hypothetical protein